jgi:hypothetical protein
MPAVKPKVPKKKPLASAQTNGKTVYVNQAYDSTTFERIVRFKAAKGLLSEQEVGRLAMSFFLEKQGF